MTKNNRKIQEERDRKILDYLDEFQSARTSTIHQLFFIKEDGTHTSVRMANKRLNSLVKDGKLKCDQEHINKQLYYYPIGRKPSTQRKHTLLTTDFHKELHKLNGVKVMGISKRKLGEIIPDSIILFTIDGKPVYCFVEVELSNKKFDMDKYIKYKRRKEYEKLGLKEMPILIVITNKRKLPDAHGINIIKIRADLSDIDKILELRYKGEK